MPQRFIEKKIVEFATAAFHAKQTADFVAGKAPVVRNPPILLRRGEVAYLVVDRVGVLQPKNVVVQKAQRARTTTRTLNDGFDNRPFFGAGAHHSAPTKVKDYFPAQAAISKTLLTQTHFGTLVVTSKRLVVLSTDVLEVPLSSLINVVPLKNGVVLERSGTRASLRLTGRTFNPATLARLILNATA